jgi:RHS repeat-associated protein
MFEVVFDYGEHDIDDPLPGETRPWLVRADPFSSYRPGFELRTYRLCQRVLMFHHFPNETGVGPNCLVRSTDLTYQDDPVASFVTAATQRGYRRRPAGGYLDRALPPLEFTYSEAIVDDTPHIIGRRSLENLPAGLLGPAYQWADMDGEGLSGILTQQGNALLYKHNLGTGHFGPIQRMSVQPSLLALGGRQQLLDLAGDGRLDLVDFGGSTPGFFDRTPDAGWKQFQPFTALPTESFNNPNLRFVDLNGDGHADILITGDDVFTWYPSLAEEGFGPPRQTYPAQDEERGPRMIFADPEQSIYLSDMCGDGLADLVRVRNGEVCYWPNLGYGRFGTKVTMDGGPWFDQFDHFDQRRLRLADIDGSGTTDLIYLHQAGTRLYFNQAGNSLAPARTIRHAFPHVDDTTQVNVLDLLGTGTACLVWSSPLPSDAGYSMRYVDLMGGQKPHLLTEVRNNLGAETCVHYASSTQFYLADQAAGRPWITRLPFPVQVIEKVDTDDRIGRNHFTTRYAYHHGYFDGIEREFRGFGMVEQYDTQDIATLTATTPGQTTNLDPATTLPPVLTRTWFHTGAFVDRERISRHFAHEYYPDAPSLPDTVLPRTLRRSGKNPVSWRLSADEQRQACRALKGSILRQEIYGLDGTEAAARPYLVTEYNYTVELLQPEIPPHHLSRPDDVDRIHAVFFVHSRERITAHHERTPDPRIGHELVLAVDDYGNVLRSAAVGYGRHYPDPDPLLNPADHDCQHRTHLMLTESSYTNPVERADAHRTPQQAETRTYELLGLTPEGSRFGFGELARKLPAVVGELPYRCWDADPEHLAAPARRLVERVRTRYRRDDLTGPLPLGGLEALALPYESYRLAFTPDLLADLYGDLVNDAVLAGAGYVRQDDEDGWWVPSGRVFYSPDTEDPPAVEREHAGRHFFAPRRFRDPFGATTYVAYDRYDLLLLETRDPLSNLVTVENYYRVLAPRRVTDANRNRTDVAFDALGMVAGTAVMGKSEEHRGDTLADFDPDPDGAVVAAHLRDPLADPDELLQGATTRLVYDVFAYQRTGQPPVVYSLVRETHVADLAEGKRTRVQHTFSYSDGFGREIQKKIQTKPGPLNGEGGRVVRPRWVGSGWTIYNNKGKPARQYEPFFTTTHRFEFATIVGVSAILFYDPVGRVVTTLHPNDTYAKVVFDPWHQATWDGNDTVLLDPRIDPDVIGYLGPYLAGQPGWRTWYEQRISGELGAAERATANKTAAHTATPTRTWLDTLGRAFLSVAHNRIKQVDAFYATRTHLDIEGNQREVLDARDRVVTRYAYDVLSHRVHQASMEAGDRLLLLDVAGKPVISWNSRHFRFRTEYDVLHRTLRSYVSGGGLEGELLFEQFEYGENQPEALRFNLRTRPYRMYDAAGVVTHNVYDFKGNLLDASRQLATEYRQPLDWSKRVPLEEQIYLSSTSFDALNRPVTLSSPDGSTVHSTYNEANLLERLEARLRGGVEPTVFIADLDYNARGQRTLCAYGNGAHTSYTYDPLTFRLTQLRTLRGHERLQHLGYSYDPAGNIAHIDDDAQQAIFFRNRRVKASSSYLYDATYRLIEATGREHLGQAADGRLVPVPTSSTDVPRVGLPHPGDGNAMGRYRQRYIYDEVGNILAMTHHGEQPGHPGWTRTYHYTEPSLLEPDQPCNRLTGTTDDPGLAPQPFTYDVHGNTTSMSEVPLMQWDFKDQLSATSRQVVSAGKTPETTYYIYDLSGQRIRKVTERQGSAGESPRCRSERIYLGNFELFHEYRGDGDVSLERETLHIMDDRQRVAVVETRTKGKDEGSEQGLRYQLTNHLASAVVEIDSEAQIVSYEEYYPYGDTSYQAARSRTEVPKRYQYTGKERDAQTGFYYHSLRYYVPWLARWTRPDPAGLRDGVNLYAYVRGNPIMLHDPSGTGGEPRQTWLFESKPFWQKVTATVKGSGISDSVRLKFQAMTDWWGYSGKVDASHIKPFWSTRAGETGDTFAEPSGPNRSRGSAESAAKAEAKAAGKFTREGTTDTTTNEPVGKRFGQPKNSAYETEGFNKQLKAYKAAKASPSQAVGPTVEASNGATSAVEGSRQLEFDFAKPEGNASAPESSLPSSPVNTVVNATGYAAIFGRGITDLHEGRPVDAVKDVGLGVLATQVLTKFPALVPLGIALSSISAYDDKVQEDAFSAGQRYAPNHPVIGGIIAADIATGESIFNGTFGAVGKAIGEGAAAGYIRLTSDEYTLKPWKSQWWSDIFD